MKQQLLSRRRLLTGALILAGGGLLSACGGSAPQTPVAPTAPAAQVNTNTPAPAVQAVPTTPKQAVTIEYWHSWGPGLFSEMVERIARAFESKNSDVKVQVTQVPGGERNDKLTASVAGGTPPDVVMIFGANTVYQFYEGGLIMPLEDVLDRNRLSSFKEWVHPNIWSLGNYDGKQISIPQWVQAYCLIGNVDRCAAAGVDPLAIKTPDDLLDAAIKTTKKNMDGSLERLGFWNNSTTIWGAVFDAQWLDSNGKILAHSPGMIQALEYIERYTQQFSFQSIDAYDKANPVAQGVPNRIFNGTRALSIEGPWTLGTYKEVDPNFKFTITPLPVQPGKPAANYTYGDHPVAIKGGKHKDASGRYITFLTGFGGEKEYVDVWLTGRRPHMPISEKLARGPEFKRILNEYPGYELYMPILFERKQLIPPKIGIADTYFSKLNAARNKVQNGEMNARTALEIATQEIQTEYDAFIANKKR